MKTATALGAFVAMVVVWFVGRKMMRTAHEARIAAVLAERECE